MFERIVVPLDGPDVSEAILPALGRVIGLQGSEVILMNVRPADDAEAGTEYLERVLDRHFPDPARVRVLQQSGAPAEAILKVVERADASLVAMATHGRRGVSRFLFGSVTEQLLRTCPAPVLAVRASEDVEARDLRTLLLPIDETLDWKASAAHAAEVARRHEAAVIVLRARGNDDLEEAERQVRHVCGELVSAGVVAYAFVEEGRPTDVIREAALAHEADMIVMATHARTRRGGTAEEVLRETRLPLMAVPAALSTAWVPAPALSDEA